MNLSVAHSSRRSFDTTPNQDHRGESHEEQAAGYRHDGLSLDPSAQALSEAVLHELHHLGNAIQNVADALTVVATADKALSELKPIFERMHDLAMQSKNGTLAADRLSLHGEFMALREEIGRIAKRPKFYGKPVLGDEAGPLSLPIGKAGETVAIHFLCATPQGLGLTSGSLMSPLFAERAATAIECATKRVHHQRASLEATAAQLFSMGDRLAAALQQFEASCAHVADSELMVPHADEVATAILTYADQAISAQSNFVSAAAAKLLQ